MNTLALDIRYGLRMLAKSPAFTAIAVLTLALGIGANTTLFSIVNGVLLNPLGYPHSNELVVIDGQAPGYDRAPIAYLNFLDWQRMAHTFSSMAVYRSQDYNLTGTDEGERLSGYQVSSDFFPTLRIKPSLGRAFRSDDDQLGAAPVVIISGGLWQRKFGSSPDVLGRTMLLNGASYMIIGVVPADFSFYGNQRDVYTPIGQWSDPSFRDRRISVSARAFGRLKPGVTVEQAQADMDAIARDLAAAYPQANENLGIALVSMKDDIVGNVQPLLLVLLAAVGFLLLIACANVASLLLARAIARSRELVVRAALGASQRRLMRQLLTESILLASFGGALGLLLAFGGTKAVVNWIPAALPRAREVSMDSHVLLFTLAISLFAGVIFGLSPALKMTRISLVEVLKESGRGGSGVRHRLHGVFVAGEVAIALVLLVGAGLMVRTLAALWRVDPGFNPSHAITFSLSLAATPSTTAAETRARLRHFDEVMQSLPGVQAVSVTLGSRPMIHDSSLPFWIEGEPKPAHDMDMHQAIFYLAEAGFQQAMGIALIRGRFITPQDDEHAPTVIAIDDAFARTYFPGQDPIGKYVNLTQFNDKAQIVGIVRHVKQWGPGGDSKSALQAQFFYPFMQLPEKLMPLVANGVAVVLRTRGDPTEVMGQARQAVKHVDPRDVIYNVETMQEIWSSSMAARRLTMILLGVFAGLALMLACVGIYGVISYLVGQRTHEIGVRMALGAQRRDILSLVLGEGAKMALIGAGAGAVAALVLTRLMRNQLFGVSAHDPLTYVGGALLLIVVALAACYIPARRAMRVDPMVALRYE
ncbi:MAG TPA: ABC transporter permease [Terriglobales bacterium]|nr:ABC transporter permease [Terriglobales bacterium]